MSGRFPVRTVAATGAVLALTLLFCSEPRVPLASADAPKSAPKTDDKSAFGQTKVWSIQLELAAKEYDAMQPAFAGGFGPPPEKEAKKDDKKRDS